MATTTPHRFPMRRCGSASVSLLVLASSFIVPLGGAKLDPYVETLPKSLVKMDMIPVPAGSVEIGGKKVDVKEFWIAKTETPWEAYDVFLTSGPPSKAYDQSEFAPDAVARPSKSYILPDLGWGHKGYPAINLSFTSVAMFCRWLSAETGKKYRLPTEAEWELACRGGGSAEVKLDKDAMEKQAWHAGNSRSMTHPIGKKEPNGLGLFDMFGNVGEWGTDLEGKPILCGPSFLDEEDRFSSATRDHWTPAWQQTDPQMPKSRWWLSDAPFAGFRLVCEP